MSRPGEPTAKYVAEAIERMRDVLFREYGVDYMFIVVARGAVLAASNKSDGVIEAVTRESGNV